MGLCGWIIFGFFAGLIARAVMPGDQKMGLIATTLLGVGGAFMGGFLTGLFFRGDLFSLRPAGFIGAVLGAALLLFIGGAMNKRRS
ncbi:MAG: GlsB/YeaQ/YmgE family stress response membrane protein [Myxococcaceae bacterium]